MPFEDQLSDSLRRTGDSFHLDDRPALIAGGLRRGRRTVRRRRTAAVTGSVVALALVGFGGAYADGLLDGGGAQETSVAAPATPTPLAGKDQGGAVTADQMVTILKSVLPGGKLTRTEGRGSGGGIPPLAYGVYDDGKGEGAISLVVDRIDPSMVPELKKSQGCASGAQDSCTTETLPDGSWLKIYKGYEYPDHRAETKDWTASLITPQGYRVDVSEWNAAAEKDAPVSRDEPPLSSAQLKALVTAKEWKPVLAALEPAGKPAFEGTPEKGTADPSAASVQKTLLLSLPANFKVFGRGSQDGYAFVVVDDGRGRSLVQINVQRNMSDVSPLGDTTTLPDGTVLGLSKRAGEKGGAGVVRWTADAVAPDGFRVVISAFNSGDQASASTRAEPALALAALKSIALDAKWRKLK
ncbi:hypothetical protein LRD69_13750 [Streptomyces sp. JH14]|uniref:hypothetical protein n=1 Tax=Streptomyces sp. JH14 TaxID=2793630 RepID=UPI0023F6388B|nr:hypothetical protein [Streptomyces sp. JH14]MDF6043195.1 hypothetical protein [Streptomyces sp. JH14]